MLRLRPSIPRNSLQPWGVASGTAFAFRGRMAFRVWSTNHDAMVVVACEGHLDEEAMAAVERALQEARRIDTAAHLRLTRGTTAERGAVARLAGYDPERLQVDSPFLRAWIDEWRTTRKDESR